MGREAREMGQRAVLVDVQPELGRLDRDLPGQATCLDRVEHGDVVVGHRVRLGEALEVLAELRVHRPDACGLQGCCGIERGLHRLAGHEPADGPAHEPHTRQVVPKPGVARGPQKQAAHQGRARTRPPSTWTMAPVT